jgi:hypothetical protein
MLRVPENADAEFLNHIPHFCFPLGGEASSECGCPVPATDLFAFVLTTVENEHIYVACLHLNHRVRAHEDASTTVTVRYAVCLVSRVPSVDFVMLRLAALRDAHDRMLAARPGGTGAAFHGHESDEFVREFLAGPAVQQLTARLSAPPSVPRNIVGTDPTLTVDGLGSLLGRVQPNRVLIVLQALLLERKVMLVSRSSAVRRARAALPLAHGRQRPQGAGVGRGNAARAAVPVRLALLVYSTASAHAIPVPAVAGALLRRPPRVPRGGRHGPR